MIGRAKRVELLADAAIALIAERGMRGLTHRAVDARADMPAGTTSAYLRTRRALVEAVVQRLVDLNRVDFAARRLPVDAPAGERPPVTPADLDRLATGIAALFDTWLSAGRARVLARYSCQLEATHHHELRQILEHGTVMREQARDILARAGAANPDRQGDQFLAFVDGLLFDRLVGTGGLSAPTPGTEESRADLRDAIRSLLRALTGR
ncbi:TetR family transcriptional regulator [Micromonospora echinospora]|uniref:Transcriptional regulator, TetR family n=1 Tax=Micromonospora echinospora TaxID=1877 RepID=A0A1C4ZYP1_MICEC|nr:TetR family transcriptional regulator [Micromonospora echinospora]OZV83861.1 TetR family transcriptional regulator [Micromonospora echinospora]SCF38080.1 transcriptional regulator, TetR family [Micromonospora echinospora]